MDYNRPHPSIYIGYLFRSLYSFWNPLNSWFETEESSIMCYAFFIIFLGG